jgi:hypothetical protein
VQSFVPGDVQRIARSCPRKQAFARGERLARVLHKAPAATGEPRSRPRTSLLGAIFDVENPMKVSGASPAGPHRQRPLRRSTAMNASRIALHNDTLRTDSGRHCPVGPSRGSPRMTHRQGGELLEGCQRAAPAAIRRGDASRGPARTGSPAQAGFPARPGWSGECSDLGGEQSPWKERAVRRRKRCRAATDSSTEQGREAGCSVGVALAVASGNGRPGRCRIPRGTATARRQGSQ